MINSSTCSGLSTRASVTRRSSRRRVRLELGVFHSQRQAFSPDSVRSARPTTARCVRPAEGSAGGALAIALAYRECSVAEALDAGYHEFLEARDFCATGGSAGTNWIFGLPRAGCGPRSCEAIAGLRRDTDRIEACGD